MLGMNAILLIPIMQPTLVWKIITHSWKTTVSKYRITPNCTKIQNKISFMVPSNFTIIVFYLQKTILMLISALMLRKTMKIELSA